MSSLFVKKLDKLINFVEQYFLMKIAKNIVDKIDRLPKGYIFTYSELMEEVSQKFAVIKALNRMEKSGKIAKLSKGKYYKPENTPFGNLQPNQTQVVKDLLEENGKISGYLTGYSVYNQLGLTTQISPVIQIGKKQVRPNFTRERYRISLIMQKNTITKENIPFLQILDAIRYIKKIPDMDSELVFKRFLSIVKNLKDEEISTLVRLALKYPPATRAILGAILDNLQKSQKAQTLFKSLNPITKYKFSDASKVLSNAERWNIV